MEYLEHGDLLVYLNNRPPLPETEAKVIAFQILEGLTMMHGNEFVHGDLKPNVSTRPLPLSKRKVFSLFSSDIHILEYPDQVTPTEHVVGQTLGLWVK